MIRKFESKDLEQVMEIWLISNMQVHDYIEKKYWQKNYNEIKRVIPLSTVYVWEEKGEILAFISAMQGYIVAQFSVEKARRHFYGKILLDYLKMGEEKLSVSVYEKNVGAVKFYMREKFHVESERLEETTGQKEILLTWKKPPLK